VDTQVAMSVFWDLPSLLDRVTGVAPRDLPQRTFLPQRTRSPMLLLSTRIPLSRLYFTGRSAGFLAMSETDDVRLNGDYNPLHATPEPGQKMGFGGAIMHGLSSWNFAAHGILKEIGGSDPKNIKEFQARFASPVKPGDKLVTQIWRTGESKDGFEEIRFITSVEGGKVCLSNGRALVKVVGKTSSKL
jgi:hypothetical protein